MSIKTSVIGFPRIGKNRELKFASEKFFKGDISEAELQKVAAEIRQYGWQKQKAAGIDFIPSNDFSFYDNVLDTAFLLNVIPERYSSLELSTLEKYFAAAHGYQGAKGDVKALPMKKWFNTNYHYIVPEIDDATDLKLVGKKPVEEFNEAKSAGIESVPTLIGAYTFLRLARYNGNKKAKDFAAAAVNAYAELAEKLAAAGAKWISFAEPALVFDVTAEERELFKTIYAELLRKIGEKKNLKIALQTYFGDIRDVYQDVTALGFDAIGLDFVEGLKSLELLKTGFPKDTLLLAGVVNGKNIWRADYAQKNAILDEIKKVVAAENVVVGTSCSLLHVPYTVAAEQKLSADILKHFAFAEEKLVEIAELASADADALAKNKALFATARVQANAKVQAELAALGAADF
jgi:5-methyltetrahydropteroyltriglutamate--homocysteine methyltransferase